MAAQAVRRPHGLRRACACVLVAAALACVGIGAAAQGTSFMDGPALADALLVNVVRVHADEHGFGVVIGADDAFVYIATAQHVVASDTPVVVHGCSPALPQGMAAARVAGFDGSTDDLALLRVPRPSGYSVRLRALAPTLRVDVRDPVWLLGRDDACSVLPRTGAVAMKPDARGLWRIDMPGVLGGSSGAPVATGRGIVGITTDSDNANITALGIERIAQRAREQGIRFDLVDARNEPPTDPQAAEQDLAEMLDQFIVKLMNAQIQLRQPAVDRVTFTRMVSEYNQAADRFLNARGKYDGTLNRHWSPEVTPQWVELRGRLQAAHENFLFVNDYARKIVETERVPAVVRDRMEALAPELRALQEAIAQFLRLLSQRRIVNEPPKT